MPNTSTTSLLSNQIVFIDVNVSNADILLSEINPALQVVYLDAGSTGLDQIAAALQGRSGIEAIHLVSHGNSGMLYLAGGPLTTASLSEAANASALQTIRASLSGSADFLIYGCNVAAGTEGLAFINALSNATGADVAASTDATGSAALGGDWVLEAQTGAIEATALDATAFPGTLSSNPDSLLPVTGSGPWSWNGISFQTMYSGYLGAGDAMNDLRANCYWDRYYLTGVASGTVIKLYMGNSLGLDDFLQVDRNGALVAQDDDAGGGQWDYDSYLSWTYQVGDVIRATTYSAGASGGYDLWISTGSAPPPVVVPLAPAESPPPAITNTAPVFDAGSVGNRGTVNDTSATDTFSNITGTLTATDATPSTTKIFSGGGNGSYGTLSVGTNGNYVYTPNAGVINALSGSSYTDTFSVSVTDGNATNPSSSSSVSFTINGANDLPTLSSDAALNTIAEDVTTGNNAGSTVASLFAPRFADVDSGSSLASIRVGSYTPNSEGTWQFFSGSWQTITSNQTITAATLVRFAPAQDFNGVPTSLTIQAIDNNGGVSTGSRSLSVNVTAVNDAPVFTAGHGGGTAGIADTSTFDTSFTPTSPSAGLTAGADSLTGTLAATDIDSAANTLTFSIRGGSLNAGVWTATGTFGTLTLNATTKTWEYVPNNDTAINAVPTGQTATDVFDFKVADGAGAYSTQSLTITVTGTNDVPELASALSDQTFDGAGSWSYQVPAASFTDAEGSGLTYTVQVVNGSDAAIDVGAGVGVLPAWLSFDEVTRTFSGNPPVAWANAPLNLKVTASDGAASISDTFTLTLTNTANQPPVVSSPLKWHAENAPSEVTSVTFTGSLGGTTLTFDGTDVTLGTAATGAVVATAVDAAIDGASGGHTTNGYTADVKAGEGNENVVVLTAETHGVRTDFTDDATVALNGGSYTVNVTTEGVTATHETAVVQFTAPPAGATELSFDNITVSLVGLTTAEQVRDAVVAAINSGTTPSTNWTATSDGLEIDHLTLTSKSDGNLGTNLTAADFNVTATTSPVMATVPDPSTNGAAAVASTVVFDVANPALPANFSH